jgi:phosphoglycerate kinase
VADVDSLRPNEQILDTGPATVADLQGHLDRMHTLVWNGPLGAFEVAPFDKATVSTARHAAALCASKSLLAIGGGGDTTAALSHANVADAFSHVSTAGGAFLQWLEGRPLPGIEALRAAKAKWGTL